MKTLFDGTQIPTQISINERIFQVQTFDGDIVLCNTETAKKLLPQCAKLKHYWDFKFTAFSKLELKEM